MIAEWVTSHQNLVAFVVGLVGLWAKWLAGNKKKSAWVVSALSQLPWIAVLWYTGVYGLLVLPLGSIVLSWWNYRKWENEELFG